MTLLISGQCLGFPGNIPLGDSELLPAYLAVRLRSGCPWILRGLCPLATPPVPFSSLQEILRPYGAFWLTAAFCILSVLFTLTFVPETKGRTLEQITAHFEGR